MHPFATVGVAALALSVLAAQPLSSQQPYTVAESIGITRISGGARATPSSLDLISGLGSAYELSPDGRSLAWIERRGNLQSGRNEFTLKIASADVLRRFVNARMPGSLPASQTLVRFETGTSDAAIRQVAWLADSRGLIFLGTRIEDREMSQIFRYDLERRALEALTAQPYRIHSFDFAEKARVLVYAADTPPDWAERNRRGFVVGTGKASLELFGGMTKTDPTEAPELRYYALDLNSGRTVALQNDSMALPIPRHVVIAPSGRWAVGFIPVGRFPAHWNDYALIREYRAKYYPEGTPPGANAPEEEEAFGGQAYGIEQYWLFNLTTGEARPLLDAPAAQNGRRVVWSRDERSVTLAGTYLPLTNVTAKERARRLAGPAAARVALDMKSVRAVSARMARTRMPRLHAMPVSRLDTPPGLEVQDTRTKRRRVVTALNDDLLGRALGTLEEVSWTDALGRSWTGGLLLPQGYERGRRYPLVIQTHGYRGTETDFELSTGLTSHPGRLFAGHGLLVLQLGCQGSEASRPHEQDPDFGEQKSTMVCYEGAVAELDRRGLIDRARVGLIGFSHTGNDVHYAVTFSKEKFAAAAIIDAVQSTLWSYLMFYGTPAPGMRQWDATKTEFGVAPFIGAQFYGEEGIRRWMERSPTFHLDNIRTPLYYEQHGAVPCLCWDTYAILKRAHRPIELAAYPLGEHNLETPLEQFTSRQRILDWFVFWLKHEERSSPMQSTPETTADLKE